MYLLVCEQIPYGNNSFNFHHEINFSCADYPALMWIILRKYSLSLPKTHFKL